jgi:hypothetical protein
VLIAAGIYALAQTLGYEMPQNPVLWAFIFGGISVISLILYFVEGVKSWQLLLPAGIFAALAFLLGMAARGADNPAMAAPLFIGIGLPFVVAYIIDRAKNWWALIPAGVMAFLTLVLFAVDNVPGEWIGSGLFFILVVVFFLVYLSRRAMWAVIVAYVMFVLGFMPLMAMTSRPELAGIIMFFAIGLPFLFVYFRSPERWWAIIPAGILLTMGIVTASVLLPGIPGAGYDNRLANSLIFAGMAGTFAIVWFRHHKRWGLWFAIVSVLIAIAGLFIRGANNYWPLIVVVLGIYMLYNALRPRTP